MTTNPLAGGLFAVARLLTDIRDRPIVEQAAFRRAISSSYYAVFRTFCQISCDGLGFWTATTEESEPIYRHLDHNKIREVLISAETRALHDDLNRIGDALVDLRRLREDADYSQPGRFGAEQRLLTRAETRTKISRRRRSRPPPRRPPSRRQEKTGGHAYDAVKPAIAPRK